MADTSGTQTTVETPGSTPALGTPAAPSPSTPTAPLKGLSTEAPAPSTQTTQAPAATPNKVEDALELKFPEGEEVDPTFVQGFKELCKTQGMTAKQAQAMVDLQFKRVGDYREAMKTHDAKNLETLKGDPDFGGAKFEANMEVAKKGVIEFGSPELSRRLQLMGLENDPAIVKHFAKLGKANSEGTTPRAPGGETTDEASAQRAHYAARYPSMK